MTTFRETEIERIVKLMKDKPDIFRGANNGGKYGGKEYGHILKDGKNNLFEPLLNPKDENIKGNTPIKYFIDNNIDWWVGKGENSDREPTGNTLSSQIACINHLYYLRYDRNAVCQLLSSFSNDFTDVFKIETDKEPYGYIQFEATAVDKNNNLNENINKRDADNTSIDALIYAKHKNDKKYLIAIEWKYTERGDNEDKSSGLDGNRRLESYTNLIKSSDCLNKEHFKWLFCGPFYQLMRQTLWAEQMIANKDTERIKADNYMHLNIIPNENKDLLKIYDCSGMNLEDTWRKCIVDQDKYKIIAPQDFLKNVSDEKYKKLKDYLSKRYWNK